MKALVEISDEQVVAVLRESIKTCFSVSQPRQAPARSHELENIVSAIEFCTAANRVIRHFGGQQVNLWTIDPFPAFPSTECETPNG